MPNVILTSSWGGLNALNALDNMPPQDCIQMDNLLPSSDVDVLRRGFVTFKEGLNVVSLNAYIKGNVQRLITGGQGKLTVYNLTGQVIVDKESFTNNNWFGCNFVDGAGEQHLILTNGIDAVQDFSNDLLNNSGFNLPDIGLNYPCSFKNRLYFVGKDSTSIFYGGLQSIAGDLTEFNVGSYLKRGGSIIAVENWTQDAGTGIDDLLVILTSEGEVLVYRGSDPDAEDWAITGVFSISRPVGVKACEAMGGDLIIITEQGVFPLSRILSQDRANMSEISDKVNPIIKAAARTSQNGQWQVKYYSSEGWLIVNIPTNNGYLYDQLIYSVINKSWCRFVGMGALCWCVVGNRLFFCNSKGIFEANVGSTDNGDFIIYQKQMAYNILGNIEKKQIMRIVPHFKTNGTEEIYKRVYVDFQNSIRRLLITPNINNRGAIWDDAIWDQDYWTVEDVMNKARGSAQSRIGNFISIGLYGRTKSPISIYSIGLLYKQTAGAHI